MTQALVVYNAMCLSLAGVIAVRRRKRTTQSNSSPRRRWSQRPARGSQRKSCASCWGPRQQYRRPSRRLWHPSWGTGWKFWRRSRWWPRRIAEDPLCRHARLSPRGPTSCLRRRSRRWESSWSRPCPKPSGRRWRCSCRCRSLGDYLWKVVALVLRIWRSKRTARTASTEKRSVR